MDSSENPLTIIARNDWDLRSMQDKNVLDDSDQPYFQRSWKISYDMMYPLSHLGGE